MTANMLITVPSEMEFIELLFAACVFVLAAQHVISVYQCTAGIRYGTEQPGPMSTSVH